MPTVIYIDKEGNLSGLADDTLDKLKMGCKHVERVSNIEYAHDREAWVATDLEGNEIYAHPIRSVVVDAERKFLNFKIEEAFQEQ